VYCRLVLLGGSGILTYMQLNGNYTFRPTSDLDGRVLMASNLDVIPTLLQQSGIQIVSGVMEVPPQEDLLNPNFIKRLTVNLSNVEVFVPKIELLACAKIFSKREKDLNDLLYTEILNECDLGFLRDLVEEYKYGVTFLGHPDMNYHQLDEIMKRRGLVW
jgi:hypothetical protein